MPHASHPKRKADEQSSSATAQRLSESSPAKGNVGASHHTGISSSMAVDRFVRVAHHVIHHWHHFTPEQRAQHLFEAAVAELQPLGVPVPSLLLTDLGATTYGEFRRSTWTLALCSRAFAIPKPDAEAAANLADTVYHETRHCEQFFRVAQLEANRLSSVDALAAALYLPKNVAVEACACPLNADGAKGQEAQQWYQANYGAGAVKHGKAEEDIETVGKALDDARNHFYESARKYGIDPQMLENADDPKALLDAAPHGRDEVLKAMIAYARLSQKYIETKDNYLNATEKDAFETGALVKARYLRKQV